MVRFTSQRTERETPRSTSAPPAQDRTQVLTARQRFWVPPCQVHRISLSSGSSETTLPRHQPLPAPSSPARGFIPPVLGPGEGAKACRGGDGNCVEPATPEKPGTGPGPGSAARPPPERPARPTAPLPSPWRARPSLARRPWAPVGECGPAPPAPRAEAPPAPPPRAGRHFRERSCVSAVAAPGRRLACGAVSFVQSNG